MDIFERLLRRRWDWPIRKLLRAWSWRADELYATWRNRLFKKYYLLDIKSQPRGAWWDATERLVHAPFQILVDYVELECSSLQKVWADQSTNAVSSAWFAASLYERWRDRKDWNKRLGLAHLEWEATLDGPDANEHSSPLQAQGARAILRLYKWYTEQRPAREKARYDFEFDGVRYRDASGNPRDSRFGWLDNKVTKDVLTITPEYKAFIDEMGRRDQEAEEEDTRMTQEVISWRMKMWT